MDREIFIMIMAVTLVLQLLLCFKAKRRIWRLLPLIAIALLMLVCIVGYALSGWTNWAYLIVLVFLSMPLGAIIFGWLICGVVKLIKKVLM